MTHYPQTNALHRATRIQLTTTPALLKLSDGKRAKATLQVVSATGGLLQLAGALPEGDFIELAFETNCGHVHGMAEILRPARSAVGRVCQPFRFVALSDDDHQVLRTMIQTASDRSFTGLRSTDWASKSW